MILAALVLPSAMDEARAQANPPAATNPVRAETQLSKIVVFISVELEASNQPEHPSRSNSSAELKKPTMFYGTGFLVSVPDSRLSNGRGFGYLVTNRHVAEAIEQDENGNCEAHQIKQTFVTMNLKEPINGIRSDRQPLEMSQQIHWYFPEDQAIDLAVIPFAAADKYDAVSLSADYLLTSQALEKDNIVPGDRILTAGFFFAYAGLHEIQPIVREGVLAMLPDGPMTTTTCKSGSVYLADVHITPGNSGSPIFIIPALGLGAGEYLGGVPSTFGLLGVVSGYMQETSNLTLRASTTWQASVEANSGVSVVVPAQQLRELLYGPGLQHLRDETVSRLGPH